MTAEVQKYTRQQIEALELAPGTEHEELEGSIPNLATEEDVKNALEKARPILLEPVMAVDVTSPDDCMGDVIGDLNSRRGRVLGMETKGHAQVIKALVPMAEILKYAPDLRSITSGRGSFEARFHHYDEVPAPIAEKVIKEKQDAQETAKAPAHA